MKIVIKTLSFLSLLFILCVSQSILSIEGAKVVEESRNVEKIAEEKLQQAEEAKKRAKKAELEEIQAKTEADKYTEQASNTKLSITDREQATVKAQEWNSKVAEYAKTKTTEEETEKTLKEEAQSIKTEETTLANEFTASTEESSKKSLLEDEYEKCIKKNVIHNMKAEKLSKLESAEFQETINQLSQKLGKLAVYERLHFYKSNEISAEQWQEIHQQAFKNPNDYDEEYRELLKAIDELRVIVAKKIEENDLKLPTTAENTRCIIELYPDLNKKLEKMNQLISDDTSSWDN